MYQYLVKSHFNLWSPSIYSVFKNFEIRSNHMYQYLVFSSYAKNFLPILFNLYVGVPAGSEEAGQRLAAFETAKLFYQISDPSMVNAMFDKALQMHKGETVLFTRDAVMDLLRWDSSSI